MTRFLLLLCCLHFLAGCATPPPETPGRFVELKGVEAEPYRQITWRHWGRRGCSSIRLTREEQDRICQEVTGKPLAFDPPHHPGCDGPFVMRDTSTGRIYAAVAIALMGYFEVEFTRTQPPKVVDTYFTDRGRTVRLPNYKALYRLGTQRWHRGEETLITFPGENGFWQ
jgi:hypothetical protein